MTSIQKKEDSFSVLRIFAISFGVEAILTLFSCGQKRTSSSIHTNNQMQLAFYLLPFSNRKSRLLWIPSDHLSIVLAISLYLLTQSLHSRNTGVYHYRSLQTTRAGRRTNRVESIYCYSIAFFCFLFLFVLTTKPTCQLTFFFSFFFISF